MADQDEKNGNVIDIRSRLPPLVLGESPTGRVASRLFKVLMEEDVRPPEHIAALMVTSIALQHNVLKMAWGLTETELDIIRQEAMVIADGMRILVKLKEDGAPAKEDDE